jgi:hypothetical protein
VSRFYLYLDSSPEAAEVNLYQVETMTLLTVSQFQRNSRDDLGLDVILQTSVGAITSTRMSNI